MHTDRPDEARAAGWHPIARHNRWITPRYLSKPPRCVPHLVGHSDRDILWIDSSMSWTGADARQLVEQVPVGGVGCFRHRWRTTVAEEAAASISLGIYEGQPVLEQAAHYGHIDELYEIGILVWRGAQLSLGVRWAAEILAWSNQDQISFPYAARQTGTAITSLQSGNAVENPWFHFDGHLK